MYITDPPLFTDIGTCDLKMKNLSLGLDGSNKFDEILEIFINDFHFDINKTKIEFDGISDMADVTSRLFSWVVSIINNRLHSLSRYDKARLKVTDLLNDLIEEIPDEIPLPGGENYIEGGISGELGAHKIEGQEAYMEIPIDASLQNYLHPLVKPNEATFAPY